MQVGRAMSSPERKAWRIFRSLDVDYVFVLFGGFIGCAPHNLGFLAASSKSRFRKVRITATSLCIGPCPSAGPQTVACA